MDRKHIKFITSIIVVIATLSAASFIIYKKQQTSENKAALKLVFAVDIIRHGFFDKLEISKK